MDLLPWAQSMGWALVWLTASCAQSWAQSAAISATQLPQGGKVVAGSATIGQSGNNLNINQSSNRAVLNWNSFNVGAQAQVNFVQPSASSVTLNRVLDTQASQILGRINANGQVFLSNPNGVLFGPTAQVDVGGLLVTTHGIGNDDLMAGKSSFEGTGKAGSVVNQGQLQASLGGYIALLAPQVRNEGVIVAKEGTVALAAGGKVTLTFSGRSLTTLQIDSGVMDALIENKHLVRADGGLVLMTARSANILMSSVIKNSGTIQSRTIQNKGGRILLLGDMQSGTTLVDGLLDASAPDGGNGGFIETSAAKVTIADTVRIDTRAQNGRTGKWLIDPDNFNVATSGGDITGTNLSALLTTTDVELQSAAGISTSADGGNVTINDYVHWSSDRTLTLTASNNVNINSNITATGNNAGLIINPNTSHISGATTQNASGTGTFNLKMGKSITLSGANPNLSISGQNYTVINSLGTETSNSDGSLQGMRGNLAGFYALGRNIDASTTSTWNSGNGFTPIGGNFTGTLHGLGNTVSNIYINAPSSVGISSANGFFYNLSSTGKVLNFGLLGGSVNARGTPSAMGSLVGTNYGLISKSYSTASVTSQSGTESIGGLSGANPGTIVDSFYSGTVTSGSSTKAIGGLSGDSPGVISNSFSKGEVITGTSSGVGLGLAFRGVGGLAGYASGTIEKSFSNSSVKVNGTATQVGGLVGLGNNLNISQSYSTGAIEITGSASYVGGFVGNSNNLIVTNTYSTSSVDVQTLSGSGSYLLGGFIGNAYSSGTNISNSYSSGPVALGGVIRSNGGFAGGVEGGPTITNSFWNTDTSMANSSATGTGKSSNQLQSPSFINDVGLNSSIWKQISGQNSDMPVLGVGASALYIRPVESGSTYGSTPRPTYKLYNMPGDVGSELTGYVVSGSANWTPSIDSSSGVATYSLSYQNGLSVSNSTIAPVAGNSRNWYIFPAPLNITVTKEYDGSNSFATGFNLSGMVNSDAAPTVTGTATVSNKNVSSYDSFLANNLTLSNGNYTFDMGTVSASITPKALTITGITAADKVYDGLTTATVSTSSVTNSVLQANGLVAGDTVTVSATGNFRNAGNSANDKNAGNLKTVLLASTYGGVDAANYTITNQSSTTASITAKPVTLTAPVVSKTYDGTTAYTPSASNLTALSTQLGVTGDTVSAATLSFNDKNAAAGTKVVSASGATLSDGNSGQNYSLSYASNSTSTITPKALTITGITAADKVYDGLTTATVSTSGATNSVLQANGLVAGDTVTVSATGNFRNAGNSANDKNAGNSKTVLLASTYGGVDAANYNIADQSTTTASITAKALTITGITAADKVYDGLTTATVSTTGANAAATLQANGLVAGDDISVSATGNFRNAGNTANDKNVGSGKTVLLATSFSGVDLGNYNIADQSTTTASITAKSVTLTAPVVSKTYDGTTAHTPSASDLTALSTQLGVTGDTISAATLSFNDKNAATGTKVVSASGATLSDGNSGQNYSLSYASNSTSTINQKALTITGITAADKVYDGLTTATVSTTGANAAATLQANGLVAGDDISVSATGNFRNVGNTANDKNVGSAKTVALASIFGGADVGNYAITEQNTTTASITPKALTITGITAADKVYDGLTTATVSTSGVTNSVLQANGLVTGDTVTVSATGNFRNAGNTANDKNAGNAKTVALSSTFGGADVGNYAITGQATTTASITALPLSVTGLNASDKSYDGSNTATLTGTATISPLIGDAVGLQNGQAQFVTTAEGTNLAVTSSGFQLTGADANNYQLTQPTGLRASITPLDLTPLRLPLTPEVMAALNGPQVASLSPDQVSYLSTEQFGALSASQLANLSPAAWSRVSTASVVNLTPEQIASMRAEAWAYWLASQVRKLSPTQLKALTPTQLVGWGSTQLQAMDNTQWQALTLLQRQNLSATQISAFAPSQVATWTSNTLSQLTPTQVTGLGTAQISALSTDQVNAFTASQWQSWTRSQIGALTQTQISALTPSNLAQWSTVQLGALNAAQVASLSVAQISALNTTQMRQLASTGQLQQWVSTDVARAQGNSTATSANNAMAVSTTATTSLSRAAGLGTYLTYGASKDAQALMVVTSERQISQLSSQDVLSLQTSQIKLMNGPQLDALVQNNSRSLLSSQWSSLSAQQLSTLSPRTWATLGREVLQNLSPQQLSSLTLEQVLAMSPTQLEWLTASQLVVFNRIALSALDLNQFKGLVSNKLSALPPQQIQALTQPQWLSLSRNQIQSLTLQQIQLLSPAQLAALPPTLWQAFSVEQIHMLAPQSLARIGVTQLNIVLKHLLPHQIQALDTATLIQLEVRQLATLSPLQWTALTPNQIAAFSLGQLNALTPTQLQGLHPNALTLLSGPQLAALSPSIIASFTALQWQSFSPGQLQALQTTQLASLSVAQLESLGPRVLLNFSPAQLSTMNGAQIQVVQAASGAWPVLTMSPAQIAAMGVNEIQTLGVASMGLLTPAQVAGLQARQLQALSLAQWQAMSPAQLAALNPAQMGGLSVSILRAWSLGQVAALSPQQVQAMSVTTLSAFTPAQWQALSPSAVAALTAQQWNAVGTEQLGALTTLQLAGLPAPWLAQLRPAQIQALNLVQIGALTPAQMAAFTPAQMQWLPPAQLSVINPQAMSQFTSLQLGALTPVQVASFSPAQVNLLTPLQMRALAPVQLQALQPAQIVALQSLQLNALTPAQIQSLTPLQLQLLTPTQVVALNPTQLQAMSPAQWNALRADNMAVLNTAQLQALSPSLVAAFNPTQISALQPEQISGFLPPQVAAMGKAQIWSLSNAQLQALTPAQIGAIRSVDLGTLLPLLRAEQIQGLSKVQLAGVNPNQLRQLTNAQTQAVLALR